MFQSISLFPQIHTTSRAVRYWDCDLCHRLARSYNPHLLYAELVHHSARHREFDGAAGIRLSDTVIRGGSVQHRLLRRPILPDHNVAHLDYCRVIYLPHEDSEAPQGKYNSVCLLRAISASSTVTLVVHCCRCYYNHCSGSRCSSGWDHNVTSQRPQYRQQHRISRSCHSDILFRMACAPLLSTASC